MNTSNGVHTNNSLRQERIRRNWRQSDLAEQLGTTVVTIKRWERGSQLPSTYFRVKLCALFGKTAEELGFIPDTHSPIATLSEEASVWGVPFPRNPFFSGRDLIFDQLHGMLTREPTSAALTQSYALCGLGGIGKTQLAIEYAYRHHSEYHAVLWVEAETRASLTSSVVRLAEILVLPEKTEEDQSKIVAAVLRWLNRHKGWLLIFDNVENLSLIKPFLPANDQGAVLLTTRLQTLGTLAQRIELPPMNMQEGCDFLLVRTNRLYQNKENATINAQERVAAEAIVTEMGGLALALEQAGAYIDATRCNFYEYLRLLREKRQHLLDAHEPSNNHPLSVSRTFSLAFEQVAQRNPLAAELLTICAFLAPDTIPEMFFLEGASSLCPTLEEQAISLLTFTEAIKVLLSYSLLQRNATTRTITVHRLVQEVLKGRFTEAEQHFRVRQVIEEMVRFFPIENEMQAEYISVSEQLVTHAQACLRLSEQWDGDEALRVSLMNHVAIYLIQRARYTEAEPLFRCAIQMAERVAGTGHLLVAEALNGLAYLYRKQGKYSKAESLFKRALCIREQALGTQHPLIATTLDLLGYCYHQQGKNEQAEPLLERALSIREQTLGSEHPQVATSLNSLGSFYIERGQYERAESYYLRALSIWERAFGSEHPQVAASLNNIGALYYEQGKYQQAESYYLRALSIWEQTLGPEHPDLAFSLTGLGIICNEQGKNEQAEAYYLQALRIWEQALGPEHPHVAFPLNNLGILYYEQGRYEQAERFYQRALHIREQAWGPDHPDVASPLDNLGTLYYKQGQYEQAERFYQRALHIREQAWGPDHPDIAAALNGLANVARESGKDEQAKQLYLRALAIRQQHLHPLHPDLAETLHDLACFHYHQRQMSEALSLYQQALAIREHACGSQHPKTKETQSVLTQLLQEMKQMKEENTVESLLSEREMVSLCACGCLRPIDTSKSRGERRRFFSEACKQRFYRNAQHQKRNAL